jgi:23S rRNA pseudouridine2605 synthase
MREGKNREVKNVLGHLGLAVNRLIRVSFGPFQLGDLPEGAVEEVKTRILRDQLGDRIAALSGADFSAPIVSIPAIGAIATAATGALSETRKAGRVGVTQQALNAPADETPTRRLRRHPPRFRGRESAPARPAPPATPKRKPGADKKRRRDAERFGEPELARRDKRRGRGPGPGKRRGR